MREILRTEDKLWECKGGYSDEGRIGYDKYDVDDETDSHEKSGKRLEFVVGSK